MTREFLRTAGLLLLAGTVVLTGCKGEKGDTGATGSTGATGVGCTMVDNGATATITCGSATYTVADGATGAGCTMADNGATATITCGSTSYTVADGSDGAGCTMADNGATATITCGTTTYTVADGTNGLDGTSCTMVDNGATATITCGTATYTVADGLDGASCTMVDNGATATITCGTVSYTIADGVDGAGCTMIDSGATATITCGATTYTVADGTDGTSCTMVDNGATATITCGAVSYTVADGVDGAPGVDGISCALVDNLNGTATITCGTNVFTVGDGKVTVESCAGCHNGGLAGGTHANGNQVAISAVTVASANSLDATPVVNGDLVITYNVKVDGLNRNDFMHLSSVTQWTYNAAVGAGTRTRYRTTDNPAIFATFTVAQNFNGNYTLRMPGFGSGGATPAPDDTLFMLAMDNGNSQPQASVFARTATVAAPPVVSNQACMNCHGAFVFSGKDAVGVPLGHHGANPAGVDGCIVCHDRDSNAETRLVELGTRLRGFVHGIHNSHNMPGRVYYRDGDAAEPFSIGFPGNMNNCATCHDSPAALASVATAPVSWATCMSCHIGPPTPPAADATAAWDGFPNTIVGGTRASHRTFDATTDCAGCHDGSIRTTLSEFHNGTLTERRGLIWDGGDQSVVLAPTIKLAITGVTVVGTDLQITWTAADAAAVAYNPCNADLAVGPVFFGLAANAATGQAASNMSIIRSYAQANDWVNAGLAGSTSPGQPAGSTTLASTNTTCAANVATTVVPVQTTAATKGVVGLQGKPQVRFTPGIGTDSEVIQVRAVSPTREFVVADGSLPADLRRSIVDVEKCKACHLGTIYQHGGNRVDSTDLCVMCHNPASSEQNVRVAMGVTAGEAYDGRAGETYDLRFMLHSIHSAGETGQPLVYYRTNGVYFFGSAAALAKVANWPGTGCQVVAGSGAPSAATGTQCDPANTTQVTKTHNFIEVHYPQPLNNCGACHVNDADKHVPSPLQAVALTRDTGAAPYNNQLDDVLMGPVAASCMSCHQSGDPGIQFGLREHAYDNGWVPTWFVNGRQTLIDAAGALP